MVYNILMEIKRKREFYSVILLILIYLLFVSIPFSMFINNEIVLFILNVSMRLLFIPFFFIYVKKERLSTLNKPVFKLVDFKYLPFLLLTFSNFIVVFLSKTNMYETYSATMILEDLVISILISFNEELVFRVVLNKEMLIGLNRIKTIVLSSLVFGLTHLLNINSFGSIPYVLLQVVYSFGVGLILSLIYTKTFNFIYVFIIHFLFDFLNGFLISDLYDLDYNWIFFVVNISLGVILGLYALLIYKKEEKDVTETMDI